jgi:flagellar motor switch protein FliG
MVNLLDMKMGNQIMADVGKADDRLQQGIQDLMFVFADLMEVDDRGMQELLRQVPADKLLLALKGAKKSSRRRSSRTCRSARPR